MFWVYNLQGFIQIHTKCLGSFRDIPPLERFVSKLICKWLEVLELFMEMSQEVSVRAGQMKWQVSTSWTVVIDCPVQYAIHFASCTMSVSHNAVSITLQSSQLCCHMENNYWLENWVLNFQVKIQGQNQEMLYAACQQFLGKSQEEVRSVALETLVRSSQTDNAFAVISFKKRIWLHTFCFAIIHVHLKKLLESDWLRRSAVQTFPIFRNVQINWNTTDWKLLQCVL